jgi:SIR2-like domain
MAADPQSSGTAGGAATPKPRSNPPYDYIRMALREGRVIPFLGAGASLGGRQEGETWKSPAAAFLPKTAELADYLERLSGYPSTGPDDLTQIAQYMDGVTGRGGLDDALRSVFSKVYTPRSVHHYLAEFTNLLIVTTNYDTLLEQAFGDKPHHVLVYNAGAPNLLLWEHGASAPRRLTGLEESFPGLGQIPIIFKMHGAPDPHDVERDSYVITDDDYLEFLVRLQGHRAIPLMFAEYFRRSHFLFLGYGLKDWNLRVILHKIWRDRARPQSGEGDPIKPRASWAVQVQVHGLEEDFWRGRGLSLYEMTVDQFIDNLRQGRE